MEKSVDVGEKEDDGLPGVESIQQRSETGGKNLEERQSNRRSSLVLPGQGSLPTTVAEPQDLEIDEKLDSGHAPSHGSVIGHILTNHPVKPDVAGTIAEESKASIHVEDPMEADDQSQIVTSASTSSPYSLLSEVTTIALAIQSGDPKAIASVLTNISEGEAIEQLTTEYSAYRHEDWTFPDGDSITGKIPAILHAAAGGRSAMFSAVADYMRKKLSSRQLKGMVMFKDRMGRTVLAMAARSGSKDTFRAALATLRVHLADEEVCGLLLSRDFCCASILVYALQSKDAGVVECVLQVVRELLSDDQVKEMLLERDIYSETWVHHAARSESVKVWEIAVKALHEEIRPEEVRDMLLSGGRMLLDTTARSGKVDMWEAALHALREELSPQQVNDMLLSRGWVLLDATAGSGKVDMWEAALQALREELSPEQVIDMLLSGGRVLLDRTAGSGQVEMWEAALKALRGELSPEQVKDMLLSEGRVLLDRTAGSGKVETWEAALKALREELSPEQVKDMLLSGCRKLLDTTASSGQVEMWEAALKALREDLSPEQVPICPDSPVTGLSEEVKNIFLPHNKPFLDAAAGSGQVEVWEAALKTLRQELSPQQVKDKLFARGGRFLYAAANSGQVEMWEAALNALREELSPEQVKDMLFSGGWMFVYGAAGSGQVEIWEAALEALRQELSPEQVKDNLLSRRGEVLNVAARSGQVEIWEAVLHALREELSPQQVNDMLLSRGLVFVYAAARSGNVDMWEAALQALREELSPEQVNDMLLSGGRMLLDATAESGQVEMWEAALKALREELSPQQVNDMLLSRGWVLLDATAGSGKVDMWEAALQALREELSPEQVIDMLLSGGRVLLDRTAGSGQVEMWEAALKALRGELSPEQVKDMLLSEGRVLLDRTAGSGKVETWEAALKALREELSPEQVIDILLSGGAMFLYAAAGSGKVEMWETALKALREELNSEKVKDMHLPQDKSSLYPAAGRGKVDMLEAALQSLRKELSPQQVKDMHISQDKSFLFAAAGSGQVEMLEAAVKALRKEFSPEQVKDMLLSGGAMFLYAAARSGQGETLEATLKALREELGPQQVKDMLLSGGAMFLYAAARSGQGETLEATLKALREELGPQQVKDMILSGGPMILYAAATSGQEETLEATLKALREELSGEQVYQLLLSKRVMDAVGITGNTDVLDVALQAVPERVPDDEEILKTLDGCLQAYTLHMKEYPCLNVLAGLLKRSARPSAEGLVNISQKRPLERLRTFYLDTVSSARNPFIPGVNLSVALAKAAESAPEGYRRNLLSLQKDVITLLLEILERLPQTVRAFKGGLVGCSDMFEPEGVPGKTTAIRAPLRVILQERQLMETFCAAPLVMDFLTQRFTAGLPDIFDKDRVLSNEEELRYLAGDGNNQTSSLAVVGSYSRGFFFVHYESVDFLSKFGQRIIGHCQGTEASFPSLTLLPGAQFIVAGVLSKPNGYYTVPIMRMVFDIVVYLATLAVFSSFVLFHVEGALTSGEVIFTVLFVVGSATREGYEMKGRLDVYVRDVWNILDVLGVVLLAIGFLVRVKDYESQWGRALYALSAPLLFSRMLFFVQVFRFQGPMIQVIFSMTAELIKFLFVLLVIMLGFAMAFNALFRSDTYGETWLHLFKAMLGEVEYFDDFSGERYDDVATVLFVVYLVLIQIMLLNLLIAILSVSHAKVQENAEREFKVAKALLINYYRWVVEEDVLPAPFNLVQHIVSCLHMLAGCCGCGKASGGAGRAATRRAVGKVIFWLVLGPISTVSGIILWVVSVWYSPFVWRNHYHRALERSPFSRRISQSMTIRYLAICAWCLLGAPLCLVFLWVREPVFWIRRVYGRSGGEPISSSPTDVDVNDLLRAAPSELSADELRKYLDDPMSDPKVRRDETKRGVTVENMKQLRDHLEKKADERLRLLESSLNETKEVVGALDRRLDQLVGMVEGTMKQFADRISQHT